MLVLVGVAIVALVAVFVRKTQIDRKPLELPEEVLRVMTQDPHCCVSNSACVVAALYARSHDLLSFRDFNRSLRQLEELQAVRFRPLLWRIYRGYGGGSSAPELALASLALGGDAAAVSIMIQRWEDMQMMGWSATWPSTPYGRLSINAAYSYADRDRQVLNQALGTLCTFDGFKYLSHGTLQESNKVAVVTGVLSNSAIFRDAFRKRFNMDCEMSERVSRIMREVQNNPDSADRQI